MLKRRNMSGNCQTEHSPAHLHCTLSVFMHLTTAVSAHSHEKWCGEIFYA